MMMAELVLVLVLVMNDQLLKGKLVDYGVFSLAYLTFLPVQKLCTRNRIRLFFDTY